MTEIFPLHLQPPDLTQLFGRPVDLDPDQMVGLDYREANAAEVAEVRTRLADILADTKIGASGVHRWEQGWAEVRARVTSDGVSEATLAPQYFRHQTLRLHGRYIRSRSASFEPKLYRAIKSVLFTDYLARVPRAVEFGCGTGLNLFQLHRLFPKMSLIGADWARPSQELISLVALSTGADMTGVHFDMRTLEGHESIPIDGDTGIVTLHAMEQLGGDFAPFLDYLVAARPKVVLHLEPIIELYDPANPFDADAIAYHKKRGYLEGFLPALRARSDIEILETRRMGFGAIFHEPYTLIAWKPR